MVKALVKKALWDQASMLFSVCRFSPPLMCFVVVLLVLYFAAQKPDQD